MRQFHKWSMNWSCNNAPSPKNGAYPHSPSRLAYLPPTSRSERNRASSPLMSRIRPKRPAFTRQAPDDLAGVAQSVPVARRQPRHAVSYRCLRCREPTIFVHAWATRCEKREQYLARVPAASWDAGRAAARMCAWIRHVSVSTFRSSNRSCRFPASGSRTRPHAFV